MAISSVKTTRLRLCVLCEAAGALLLRRSTTSSCSSWAWAQKRRAFISALHSPPSVSKLSALQCTPIAPTSPSSPLHGFLPLVGGQSYSTSRTQLVRKTSTKSCSASRASANKRSLTSGKLQKQGGNTTRSVTARASSRQKDPTSADERDNSTLPHKARVTTVKTALKTKRESAAQKDSRAADHLDVVQKQGQRVTLVAKPATPSRKVMRSQEDKYGGAGVKASPRNIVSVKKGKRVMRLDPHDKTSKRLLDGYPLPGEEVSEAPAATAGRVQFRQIVPSPKLMQHIQKHMLGRRRPSELQRAGYDTRIMPAPLDNIPYSKKGERQPIQEEVFRHKLRFTAAAKTESSCPPLDIPEVAFAGRSNVGKSSLINALTRQWGAARTSDKPGLTQSINFFRLGGRLCLVDLPGYGFAYAADDKKDAWEELVREFVTGRAGLKRVYVLVDAKWGLKLKDEEFVQLMEKAGTKYQIVLTKSDTVTPVDLARRVTQVQEVFKNNKSLTLPMLMVSSKTGEGMEFFRANVARLAKASLI